MGMYFVRHGQTDWNLHNYLQGSSDICLNEKGKEQARQTARLLKEANIEKIYASPLLRARETAEIINSYYHVPLYFDARLKERSFGKWEGKSRDVVDFNSIWKYDTYVSDSEGEDMIVFFKRVYAFLDDIAQEACDKNILIAAHGGVSIPFQCYFDGIQENRDMKDMILGNCEVLFRGCK